MFYGALLKYDDVLTLENVVCNTKNKNCASARDHYDILSLGKLYRDISGDFLFVFNLSISIKWIL